MNLTPRTGNFTANRTITPSGAVFTADSTDVTANYEISCVTGKLVIKPDTSKIDSLTTENVTSANKNDIQAVLDMMADAETEDGDEETLAAWAAITAKCQELIERIEAVNAENNRIIDAVAKYELTSVKSSDKAAIVQLISDIDEQLATNNLTSEERKSLEDAKAQAEDLLDSIDAAASSTETENTETVLDDVKAPLDDAKTALDDTKAALAESNESADSKNPPQTGDNT